MVQEPLSADSRRHPYFPLADIPRQVSDKAVAITVLLAALIARLPALGTWWCLDDWGQLARAAGKLESPAGMPARWLSQHAWWSLTWPLLGLDASAHALLRILLHAAAAVAVVRIARRASLGPFAQLTSGLVFAATPMAFTSLYWASGIQELLAGTLALFAVERWLAGGGASVIIAGLLGAGSILAKESALALPLFFMATLALGRGAVRERIRLRWAVAVLLVAIAGLESLLILRHFAHGEGDRYVLGGPLVILGNLGTFGWWLPTPGPVFTARMSWSRAGIGIALLVGWGVYGLLAWRRGRRLPLAAWACALVSVVPVLPLVFQVRPYMGYLAAAAASLTLGSLVPWRRVSHWMAAWLVIAAVLWGQWTMRERISRLESDGLPADPVVRAAHIARTSDTSIFDMLPPNATSGDFHLVIFQVRLKPRAEYDPMLPDKPAVETPCYTALAGPVGVQLLLGGAAQVQWTSSLLQAPADAFVICETTSGFQAWGDVHDALLYAAELHVFTGGYEQAAADLSRARALDPNCELRIPDADVLGIPTAALRAPAEGFQRWLEQKLSVGSISKVDFAEFRSFPLPNQDS